MESCFFLELRCPQEIHNVELLHFVIGMFLPSSSLSEASIPQIYLRKKQLRKTHANGVKIKTVCRSAIWEGKNTSIICVWNVIVKRCVVSEGTVIKDGSSLGRIFSKGAFVLNRTRKRENPIRHYLFGVAVAWKLRNAEVYNFVCVINNAFFLRALNFDSVCCTL